MESSSVDEKKLGLSFGFKRKQDVIQLGKSVVSEDIDKEVTDTDYVLSLEDKEVKSTKGFDKSAPQEYVIPLIKQNKWRNRSEVLANKPTQATDTSAEPASLDEQAAKEILRDTAIYNQHWEDRGLEDVSVAIPLLLQNKIPEGFESEDRLDVALRPDEPDEADYEQIPIEQFGLAMLRGMGWTKARGVGKSGQVITPVEAHIRPKGLGLGADRNNSGPDKKNTTNQVTDDKEGDLVLKKNAFCLVVSGIDKNLYGSVEGVDEDNSRVVLKLAPSGKVVNVMQANVRVVTKKEFDKYSKYLNREKVESYKEKEKRKTEENGHHKHKDRQSGKDKHDYKQNERVPHKRETTRSTSLDEDSDDSQHKIKKRKCDQSSHEENRNKTKSSSNDKKRYCKDKKGSSRSNSDKDQASGFVNGRNESWLRNDLRVRVIDKSLGQGKYHGKKVVIIDVPSRGKCVCKTDDGKLIEDVLQSSLETVVPRSENAFVTIVAGPNLGKIGQIMKRDKAQCLAFVQLLADRDTVLKLHYDEICEYMGDIQSYDDY